MVRGKERSRWNHDLRGVVGGLPMPSTPHLERSVTEQMLRRQIFNIQEMLQRARCAQSEYCGEDLVPLDFRCGTQNALINARQAAGKAAALAEFLEQKTTVRGGRAPEQYCRDHVAAMPFLGSPSNAPPRRLRCSIGTGHAHLDTGAGSPSPVRELHSTARIPDGTRFRPPQRHASAYNARQLPGHYSHATFPVPPPSPQIWPVGDHGLGRRAPSPESHRGDNIPLVTLQGPHSTDAGVDRGLTQEPLHAPARGTWTN
eukprot:GEMP01031078.1.p1 GENE.GEMP01031078.1~~GEMP01031078.1.p1  ORF type:complete len:258 (+),score=51.93 GEMP01031078.1:269-1042(+)